MENNVIDSNNLQVDTGECRRLSYKMLFSDSPHAKSNGTETRGDRDPITLKEHQKNLREAEEKWQVKLEEVSAEAYQKGLEEGFKKGEKKAQAVMEQKGELMKEVVCGIENHINELMDELKPRIATLVFDITEKILGLPLKSEKLGKEVTEEVGKLLLSFDRDIHVKLIVSSSDYGFMVRALKDLPNAERVQLSKSDELSTGEYTVDTENERIVKNFKKMLLDFRDEVALEEFELETTE